MKNYVQDEDVIEFTVVGAHSSGDPIAVGQISGVIEEDVPAAGGTASLRIEGVVSVSVKGHDGTNPAAIAIGDPVYYNSGHTPVLDVTTAGVLYGYALDIVGSNATTTIRVLLKH